MLMQFNSGTNTETDWINFLSKNDSESTEKALSTYYQYLSCISYTNKCLVIESGECGFGKSSSPTFPISRRFYAADRLIVPVYSNMRYKCIPKISTRDQSVALSIYREVRSSFNPFYKFFCFWKILEMRAKSCKDKNDILYKYYQRYCGPGNAILRLKLNPKTLGKSLNDKYRNAIAHITRPQIRIADSPEDKLEVNTINHFFDAFIENYIEAEFQMHDKLCLVKMPKEKYPRYVSIEEFLKFKLGFDDETYACYMKTQHKSNHDFSDSNL
jgi:hypothetical protein